MKYIRRFFLKKHIFNKDNIFAIIVLFAFFKLVGSIQLSVLDPIGDAFEDVELTDIVFSQFNKNSEHRTITQGIPNLDTNVVIVNVGNLKRQEIAQLLNRVNACKPTTVGIDVFFEGTYRHKNKLDTIFDNMLATSLANTKNLVLVSGGKGTIEVQKQIVEKDTILNTKYPLLSGTLIDTTVVNDSLISGTLIDTIRSKKNVYYNIETNQYPEYHVSDDLFTQNATCALANLVTDLKSEIVSGEEFKVCRKLLTHAKIKSMNDTIIECFALALVDKYDHNKANIFRKRIEKKPKGQEKAEETINYTGNIFVPFQQRPKPRYQVFDISDVFNPSFTRTDSTGKLIGPGKDLEGKIVLLGFLGGDINIKTGEDKFFTPLNERYIGKTNEDMYGVVIHANVITMIMEELYIDSTPTWLGHVFGIILTYLCMGIFRAVYFEFKHWYDGLTKVLGVIIAGALLFVIGFVFDKYDLKITLPAIYFAAIVLAGDLLEIYYGLLKNLVYKIRKKEIKEN